MGQRRISILEEKLAQLLHHAAIAMLRIHEHIADQCIGQLNAGGAHKRQPPDAFRVSHRHFGRDPATKANTENGRPRDPERVENIEIVKGEIVDVADACDGVRIATARMGRRDQPHLRGEFFMKGEHASLCRVEIPHVMQVEDRFAAADFQQFDRFAANVDGARRHALLLLTGHASLRAPISCSGRLRPRWRPGPCWEIAARRAFLIHPAGAATRFPQRCAGS